MNFDKIGEGFRTQRVFHGLTIKKAAEGIGISAVTLKRLEEGNRCHMLTLDAVLWFYGMKWKDVVEYLERSEDLTAGRLTFIRKADYKVWTGTTPGSVNH